MNTYMKTYENINDLLEGDTMWRFGRSLYKHTDCGPWTTFHFEIKPKGVEVEEFAIIRNRIGEPGLSGKASEYTRNCLCFDDYDRCEEPWSWETYLDKLRVFLPEDASFRVEERHANRWVMSRVNEFPAETKAIYYDSRMANANKGILAMHGLTNCTSVEIGSIVEGSDVEITGRHLEFPFTSEQLDATVKGVDDEASFYWKRDNTRNHCVTDGNGRKAFVSWTAFDDQPTWHDADDLPVEVKKAYLEWEGCCGFDEKHAEPLCEGWKIREVCDDSTY